MSQPSGSNASQENLDSDVEKEDVDYKVPPPKNVNEIMQANKDDPSMTNYVKNLYGDVPNVTSEATPKVTILQLAIEVKDRPDIIVDVSSKEQLEKNKSKPFVLQEGCTYQTKVKFKVSNQLVSGLKLVQKVTKKGMLKVSSKDILMMGSYPPGDKILEKKFKAEEAPSGTLGRGAYQVHSQFTDDDKIPHFSFIWNFEIKKDWE